MGNFLGQRAMSVVSCSHVRSTDGQGKREQGMLIAETFKAFLRISASSRISCNRRTYASGRMCLAVLQGFTM